MSTRQPTATAIYGIGNPLIDIIVRAEQGSAEALGVSPGSMNLVDEEKQRKVQRCGEVTRRLAGGSCANTVRAARWLLKVAGSSGVVAYTGAVGRDRDGDALGELLDSEGVEPLLARTQAATGSSVIVVTPDYQRTMFTCLGACRELQKADINTATLRNTKLLHLTGYMWDTPNQEKAAGFASGSARQNGAVISFDIADYFVVQRYRDALLEWIPRSVDYLFANEAELRALTGEDGDRMRVLNAARDLAPTVIMKTGGDGCMLINSGEVTQTPAFPADPVDTTGAGDAFAGGFIFGLIQKQPLPVCAAMANRLAGGIVTVEGCDYDKLDAAAVAVAFAEFR